MRRRTMRALLEDDSSPCNASDGPSELSTPLCETCPRSDLGAMRTHAGRPKPAKAFVELQRALRARVLRAESRADADVRGPELIRLVGSGPRPSVSLRSGTIETPPKFPASERNHVAAHLRLTEFGAATETP